MFAVAMLFLTVHPDFYLPNDRFDEKHCQKQLDYIQTLARLADQYGREIASAKDDRRLQIARAGRADALASLERTNAIIAETRTSRRKLLLIDAQLGPGAPEHERILRLYRYPRPQ